MSLEKLCRLLEDFKFDQAVNYITTNKGGVLDTKDAIYILCQLCKIIPKSEGKKLNSADIFNLAVLCCKNVHSMNEKEIGNFLITVYHVIKHLFLQGLINDGMTLCNFIKKHCLDSEYRSELYGYYLVLFHNHILVNAKQAQSEILIQSVFFSMKAMTLSPNISTSSFITKVKLYPNLFKNTNINNAQRNIFCLEYLSILKTIKDIKKEHMLEFYQALLNVAYVTIFNLYGCDYTIPEFINETFEAIIKTMSNLCQSKEYLYCINILSTLFNAIVKDSKKYSNQDAADLSECNKNLRGFIRKYGLIPPLISTCHHISKVLRTVFEYYSNNTEIWIMNMPVQLQIQILRTIEVLESVLVENTFEIEKFCTDCKFKTDIFLAATITSFSGEFVLKQARLNLPIIDEIHQITLKLYKKCCQYIHEIWKKDCEKIINVWRGVGSTIYNIGVVLYKNKHYEIAKSYMKLFISNVIMIEGVENTDICFQNSLGSSLHLLASCYQYLNNKLPALQYLALAVLLSEDFKLKALHTWVAIKVQVSEDQSELRYYTIHRVLTMNSQAIKEIYPGYTYNPKKIESALLSELHYYVNTWNSREAIYNCCLDICNVSESVVNKTKALTWSWEKITQWQNWKDDDIISHVETLIKSIAKSNEKQDMICLSVLSFILYQFKFHHVIVNNLEDMNSAQIPLKNVPLQPFEDPVNPNDKCDIVPAFNNLKIDNALKLYQILDKCIEIWELLLDTKESNKFDFTPFADFDVGNFIKRAAFECRLQHLQVKMLKLWFLSLKFARLTDDTSNIISSIGFLLEYSDCKSKKIIELQKEAQQYLKGVEVQDGLYWNLTATFYINLCTAYLNSNNVDKAYEVFWTLQNMPLEKQIESQLIEIRMLHLQTRFLMMPCIQNIMDHEENFLTTAQKAYFLIADYYKLKGSRCAYLTSILFEISLFNGWVYKYLRLPREVRGYMKEITLLAQKCVLPLRTAQFLSLLAFTDLLDAQYLDCEVKLTGLMKILGLESYCSIESLKEPNLKIQNIEEILETEINDFDCFPQIVLDAPARERVTCTELGSPNFKKKAFEIPEFIKHRDSCNCFICINYEYQKLVMDTIHIEALLNKFQNMSAQSQQFFNGGLLVYKKLHKKIKEYNPISIMGRRNEPFVFNRLHKNISNNYCTFLLDFTYFLVHKSAFKEANEYIETIVKLMTNSKNLNIHFWNEVMLQKANIFIQTNMKDKLKINAVMIKSPENDLLNPVSTVLSITPDNKISNKKVILSNRNNQVAEASKVKSVRKIKFDLSDSDDESVGTNKNLQLNKNAYFKLQTPAKTPAPLASKIKIYTPKTIKMKRTRCVSSSTSENILKTTTSKDKSEHTVNKQLQERTRLLTEKLKAEKKTALKDINQAGVQKTAKPVSCKNLLEDLTDITASVESLTLTNSKTKSANTRLNKPSSTTEVKNEVLETKKTDREKKYSRIKEISSSSSASSTEPVSSTRKSSRNKKL